MMYGLNVVVLMLLKIITWNKRSVNITGGMCAHNFDFLFFFKYRQHFVNK